MPVMPVGGHLIAVVERLLHLRQQIKELQTEEGALREEVITALAHVAPDDFPVLVGTHRIRISRRPGRLDEERAWRQASALGLADEVEREVTVKDAAAIRTFPNTLAAWRMPQTTRRHLTAWYHAAWEERPRVCTDQWDAWHEANRLDEATYLEGYKDRRPQLFVLQIR